MDLRVKDWAKLANPKGHPRVGGKDLTNPEEHPDTHLEDTFFKKNITFQAELFSR